MGYKMKYFIYILLMFQVALAAYGRTSNVLALHIENTCQLAVGSWISESHEKHSSHCSAAHSAA